MKQHSQTPANAIARATAHSPYLAGLISRWPDVVAQFSELGPDTAWAAVDDIAFPNDVGAALRQERGVRWMVAALADLAGNWPLEIVVGHLSDFADVAIDRALKQAFAERANWVGGSAAPVGFAIIALGKHGSRELNYSSDIDPILIFDPQTMPRRDRDDPGEAAVRIGRRMIELLSARTEDGFVFRVDLRLRPASEITPIVLPVNAAISHYESAALAWEQAAFIRARATAGDAQLGQHFLSAIQPFIWRRALDFGQITAIRDVSLRIRDHYSVGQAFGPGYDLKRGRGGIRECEFFAQVQQLIHGGRNSDLRAPATLDALSALAQFGHVSLEQAQSVANAYRLFRSIEHRLQMVGDQQTHSLPHGTDALDAVARLHGLANGTALVAQIAPHVAAIGAMYDDLIGEQQPPLPSVPQSDDAMASFAVTAGFPDGAAVAARIHTWRSGQYRALRSAAALSAMEAALPALIQALGQSIDPVSALNRIDQLIAGLPSALNLFGLLQARPDVLGSLMAILSHAPTLAEALGRQPALLDSLIDQRVMDVMPDAMAILAQMREACVGKPYETVLDSVRQAVGDLRFQLGVQLIEGHGDPMSVSRGYSDVADAALLTLANATITEFQNVHGSVPDSELMIIALGRFGGQALTHASDLDLIYLFTGDYLAESDGAKPLGATLYYTRLAQRITAAMSVPTASGRLYDIDTRLRPSGADGPLVVSVDSFTRYQKESAWTWEHMALTRARIVYGSPPARKHLESAISDVLHIARDSQKLIADAVQMRTDMAAHKPAKGPLDVKMGDGGLVDLEFALHVTQLWHGRGFSPNIDDALAMLIADGLVPADIAAQLQSAYGLLARLLVVLRLAAPDGTANRESHAVIAQICGAESWATLMVKKQDAQNIIASWWRGIQRSGE